MKEFLKAMCYSHGPNAVKAAIDRDDWLTDKELFVFWVYNAEEIDGVFISLDDVANHFMSEFVKGYGEVRDYSSMSLSELQEWYDDYSQWQESDALRFPIIT